MKVLLVSGTMRENGCTNAAMKIVEKKLNELGVETDFYWIPNEPVYDCLACNKCAELKKCCIDDSVNVIVEKAKEADGFIFGSPVYYSHPTGKLLSVLDRAFYSGLKYFMFKPGAAVLSARRAGNGCSFDTINKYFTISCMPVVSSTYWNMVHGKTAEDVYKDVEGVATLENLAVNMAWQLQNMEAGKEAGVKRPKMRWEKTNFIREDL